LYDPSSVMCYTVYPHNIGFVMDRSTWFSSPTSWTSFLVHH